MENRVRTINYYDIVASVEEICIKANRELPAETRGYYQKAFESESGRARSVMEHIIENSTIAAEKNIAICQDTGVAVFFVKLGVDVVIDGGPSVLVNDAIEDGVKVGYEKGYLRKSMVSDPLFNRKNTGNNLPAIIHLEMVDGDSLEISFAPKGGGAENMSALSMMPPSAGVDGVIDFVVDTVTKAWANPCPPIVVGVGIGGNFEKAPWLAKKALLREDAHQDPEYRDLEVTLLSRINETGIGPQGFGGKTTAFAVRVEWFPCHIASLPVGVNINCHVHRHMTVTL